MPAARPALPPANHAVNITGQPFEIILMIASVDALPRTLTTGFTKIGRPPREKTLAVARRYCLASVLRLDSPAILEE